MGIAGLIPFLEKASSKIHLNELRGSCVAVDTYCWLHKGVFGCAEKLVRGEETDLYIQYCLKYIHMLLTFNIKPILVFDGQHLPAKALTEKRRRESRQQSKKRATELLRLGRLDEARSQMRRCVDVTHEMALRLIRECRKLNVDSIVAPYEADAQMAWFSKTGIVQYIITEDSDLTLFGARNVIFKLDLSGNGLLVESEKLYLAMGCRKEKYTFEKFRRMCILSGCDYLDSLPGIGLAKACKFILKTEQEDMWKALKKIPEYLNMRNLQVDESYIENFLKAEATFRHMYIYNPIDRQMERLYALSDYETAQHFCSNAGILLDDTDQALQLALGNLNPFTLKQLDNWHPDHSITLHKPQEHSSKRSNDKSIWQPNYTLHSAPLLGARKIITGPRDTCALFFKKVDFISKSLNAEIEANIRSEQAIPEESEVFSIYQSSVKRNRLTSTSSTGERTPPASPASKRRLHNPFIKDKTLDELQRSPAVCENGSLLRLLSPKKEMVVGATKEQSHRKTEVRSRFFEANVRDVLLQQVRNVSNDQCEKNDELEKQAKESYFINDYLVNNQKKREEQPESTIQRRTDSGDKCVTSDLFEISANDAAQPNCLDTLIFISDESNDSCSSQKRQAEELQINSSKIKFKPMPTKCFQRLGPGLSKPKSNFKNGKKYIKITDSGQSQTRLSMFGFQKRPTL